ncbi:metallophosphoesterase [Ekhidna sp.]
MRKAFKYLSFALILILSLSAIWFRFIVDENNEFKNSTIFEHYQSISTDGPHILYNGDSLRMIRVEKNENNFDVIDIQTTREKFSNSFSVNTYEPDKSQPISFEVILKNNLEVSKSTFPDADSILVISDIEGNFYAFHKLLKANNVIDEKCNWMFGKGHLVLVGDFVDRGLNVTQCLWLAYKLEQQAIEQGGNVHFIIGNHEILNLQGKLYHVRSKYKNLAKKLKLDYSKDLYGINSELGRWIRSKNSLIKIGDLLFTHAGISREFLDLKLSIETTNQVIRDNIDGKMQDSISLTVTGINGPYWTRKMGHDSNEETVEILKEAMEFYNFKTLIIGHSTVPDLYQHFDNSLINVDVHFPFKDSDLERGKALFIENNIRYKVDDLGNRSKI